MFLSFNFNTKLEFVRVSNFNIFWSKTLKVNEYTSFNSAVLTFFYLSNTFQSYIWVVYTIWHILASMSTGNTI